MSSKATFEIPTGTNFIWPVIRSSQSFPSRSFLATVELDSKVSSENVDVYKNYSWSDSLKKNFNYLAGKDNAPNITSLPAIYLPTASNTEPCIIKINLLPWGETTSEKLDIFSDIIICYKSALGNSIIYPTNGVKR